MKQNAKSIQALAAQQHHFITNDKVRLDIHEIAEGQTLDTAFPDQAETQLLAALQCLNTESHALLGSLAIRDKDLAQLLRLQEKKIALIAQTVANSSPQHRNLAIQDVTLSEGGLVVSFDQSYALNKRLAIQLILLPNHYGLLLAAKVLSCTQTSSQMPHAYELHLQFVDISEAQQQLIARHIMRKQSEQGKHSS